MRRDPKVSILRCKGYDQARVDEAIEKAIELLGGIDRFVRIGRFL